MLVHGFYWEMMMRAREFMENQDTKKLGGLKIFELSEASRAHLATIFSPKFKEFIGHHITYGRRAKEDTSLASGERFRVVGYACDDQGIEALVVEVDGTTSRPDGKIFHITWSLDRDQGFKPVMSNALIEKGWTAVPSAINITATPSFM